MKILVIRFSSIGDIVLTSALVRCLKKQRPEAEIHFLVRNAFVPILEANPYIQKIIVFNNKASALQELKNEKYDYIIDLQKNFRTLKLKLVLHTPAFSFPKLNIRKWILVNFKINLLPDVHVVNRYFKAVEPLGVVYDNQGLDFFFREADSKALSILPPSYEAGFFSMSCGSMHKTKQIPEELMLKIIELSPLPLVLLGGKEDAPLAERLHSHHPDKLVNACGRLSIRESAYLLSQCTALISADTGLMHIAAALKKRVISVWGNTVPAFGMTPFFPSGLEKLSSLVEVSPLSCRPCSKLGFEKCPKKHFKCMMNHKPENIIELALKTED